MFVQDFHKQSLKEMEGARATNENHIKSLNLLKERVLMSPQAQSSPKLMARISNLERHLVG